jgi:hypothetical protein
MVENKILSWENLQRRGFNGPGICTLCKMQTETTHHLFMECAFTVEVWRIINSAFNFSGNWIGISLILSDCFKQWTFSNNEIPTLPALICWYIWNERNQSIFEDNIPSVKKVIHLTIISLRDNLQKPKS